MRVFLAGASGFIGGAVLRTLLTAGHEVTALLREGASASAGARVDVVRGDVTRPGAWQERGAGHDAAVNCVGILRRTRGSTFEDVVVAATRNLVDAAKVGGAKRFIQMSANGIDAAAVPYQRTKLEAERLVRASGIPFTIFRPSVVYGPGDGFTVLFSRLMRGGIVPYFGRSAARLAPVHVDDVAMGVANSLRGLSAVNRTFTLCGPEAFTFVEFLHRIREGARRRCLIVWAPRWLGFALAAVFGRFSFFPADVDALRMLDQGNTCADDAWRRELGVAPRAIDLSYLRRPM